MGEKGEGSGGDAGGKWGGKGEGSGGKGGGNWEWGTPLSTPSSIFEQADRPYVWKPCEKNIFISSDFALFFK